MNLKLRCEVDSFRRNRPLVGNNKDFFGCEGRQYLQFHFATRFITRASRSTRSSPMTASKRLPGNYRLPIMLVKLFIFVASFVVLGLFSPGLAQERLSPADLENLLSGGVHQARIVELVKRHGVNFEWTDDLRNRLKKAGAGDAVMQAVDGAVIRFRLAEQAKRDELKTQQESAEKTRTPPTKAEPTIEKQAVKSSEAGKKPAAPAQTEQKTTSLGKTDTSQQKVQELPSQLKETADQVLALEKIAIRDGEVSGELVNRSSQGVYGVELQVLYSWRWNNDFHPGRDDPGRAEYFKIDKEISPGQRVPFVHKPSPPLSARKDGTFEITIKVVSFTRIFRETKGR